MKIKRLTIEDAEYIAHRYAVERLNFENEPMPAFNDREAGKLESCLAEPFQTFGGRPLHWSFIDRAALLFYLIAKNHCFPNGNKRMAVTLTSVFFFINGRWLNIPDDFLYRMATDVAKSKRGDKERMQRALRRMFKEYQARL